MEDRYGLTAAIPPSARPVVFIGPYEHHSNELPWRESIADVVTIHEDLDGGVDLDHLERELKAHADRPLKIGSFSAASNVTGIISDTAAISSLLHSHDALSFWDAAAARGVFSFCIEHESGSSLPEAPPTGAGPLTGVDHVVVKTQSVEAAKQFYGEQLGIRLALEQHVPEWGGTQLFFREIGRAHV